VVAFQGAAKKEGKHSEARGQMRKEKTAIMLKGWKETAHAGTKKVLEDLTDTVEKGYVAPREIAGRKEGRGVCKAKKGKEMTVRIGGVPERSGGHRKENQGLRSKKAEGGKAEKPESSRAPIKRSQVTKSSGLKKLC